MTPQYGPGQRYQRAEAAVLDPGRLLGILRRHWPWLLIPPILLAAVGGLLALRQPSRYESTAMIVLQPTAAQDRLSGSRSNALAEREIQTEEQLLNGSAMSALVRADVGPGIDFDARAVEGTDLIELTAETDGAELAAQAADAVADLYISQRRDRIVADLEAAITELEGEAAVIERELEAVDESLTDQPPIVGLLSGGDGSTVTSEPQDPALVRRQSQLEDDLAATEAALDQLRAELALTDGNARLAAAAVPPSDRISPNPVRSAVVWAMLGIFVGLGLVWVRDLLDRRIRSAADLSQLSGTLDFVGRIGKPSTSSLIGPAVLLFEDVADRFRVLATNSLTADDQPVTIQVTGVQGGEGATFVAANLASTLAIGGWASVLVDADFAAGDLHDVFGVGPTPGTKQLLQGERLSGVVQATQRIHGLGIIARGSQRSSDATLHNSSLAALLRSLSDRFDVVIVDSPPILDSGDAAVLAQHVDKTVLVAAVNETTQPRLDQAVEAVAASGGRVTAVALTEPSRAIVSTPIQTSVVLPPDEPRPNGGPTGIQSAAAATGRHLRPGGTRGPTAAGGPESGEPR